MKIIIILLFVSQLFNGFSEGCFLPNTLLVSNDKIGSQVAVSSSLNCQIACQNHNSCQFFSFQTTTKECQLISTTVGEQASPDSTSGPKFCNKQPNCLQLNHDYHTGPNLPSTFAGVPSLYQCQQLCLEDPKCLTFAVVHNSQDCVLKSGGDAFSISSSDYDVGKRVCEESNCLEYQSEYGGVDVGMVPWVPSATHCQYECQKMDSCSFFTYVSFNGACYLKSVKSPTFEITKISGPKFCKPPNNFMKYSAVKSLAGFSRSFSETKSLPSLIPCASHCNLLFLQKLKCSAFIYNKSTMLCETFVFGPSSYNRFYSDEEKANTMYISEASYA